MESFRNWLSQNEHQRIDHLAWQPDDILPVPVPHKLEEEEYKIGQVVSQGDPNTGKTFENRAKQPMMLGHHNRSGMRGTDLSAEEHLSHREHARNFSPQHLASIEKYKRSSHHINNPLRHLPPQYHYDKGRPSHLEHAKHLAHLDDVTSHRLHEDHVVFRGVGDKMDLHKMPVGHEFIDHAYTGTSHDHQVAAGYGTEKYNNKPAVFRIKAPKGTKAYHLDFHDNSWDAEHETLLHRGTKFRVARHTEYPDMHVTDLDIVSQGHKREPKFGY